MSSDSSDFSPVTDSDEEGYSDDEDLSHLGAAQTKMESFSVKQESYQCVERGSRKHQLAKRVIESCHPPGEIVPTEGSHGSADIQNNTTMVQQNFIQVQQQFGDVTVQGTRNLTIGGTQNIGQPGPAPEHEKQLTWTEKILNRTVSRIEDWTRGMVRTSALEKLLEKMNNGETWITITGNAGDGKTTVAYMALRELHKYGRQVFKVTTPEEFSKVIMTCSHPVILLDDVFGNLEFDQLEWLRWKTVLFEVLAAKEHRSHETVTKGSEITVILVAREYVLNTACGDLGRMSGYFTSDIHVINMSNRSDGHLKEKLAILEAILDSSGMILDQNTKDKICQINGPHGFPHVCRLFVTHHRDDARISAEDFFKTPLEFLNQTMQKFMQDKSKVFLFKEMIKRNGQLSVRELENMDYSTDTVNTADSLVETYLRKEDGHLIFDHPSIYDSVAFNLGKRFPLFIIENCHISFIHERLRLEPSRDTRPDSSSNDSGLLIQIPRCYVKDLAKRFAAEISNRHFVHVLAHAAFTDDVFIKETISLVTLPITQLLKVFDTETGYVFLCLATSSKSPRLIQYIDNHPDIQLTEGDIAVIFIGVCLYAASDILTYLTQTHGPPDINYTYGAAEETPLMIAAGTRDSEFVQQVMLLHPDMNARESGLGRTAFHFLCENGLASAVQQAIDTGIDIDTTDWYGRSPLFYACENNQIDVMHLLLDRGAQIDASAVVTACAWGSIDTVSLLFERGATVNMTLSYDSPFTSACQGGDVKVISFLIAKGASVNKAHMSGRTPLHVASENDKPQAILCLLEHGADINAWDSDGHSPLHAAACCRSQRCTDVLLKAGAVVDSPDNHGQTPLHKAVNYKLTSFSLPNLSVCETLISYGAGVNRRDTDGNTPLHLLCDIDSDTEIDTEYSRVQASSCEDLYRKLLRSLVAHGADVNLCNNKGEQALGGWCQTLM